MNDKIESMEDVRALIREMDIIERKGLLMALYESDLILKERFRAMAGIDKEEYCKHAYHLFIEIMDAREKSMSDEEIRTVANDLENDR